MPMPDTHSKSKEMLIENCKRVGKAEFQCVCKIKMDETVNENPCKVFFGGKFIKLFMEEK